MKECRQPENRRQKRYNSEMHLRILYAHTHTRARTAHINDIESMRKLKELAVRWQ